MYQQHKANHNMKFIINKAIGYTHKDRVLILKREETRSVTCSNGRKEEYQKETVYLCNVVLKVTNDWNLEDEFSIVDDKDSIQYRPKAIFASNKGYFYKNPKVTYLSKDEVDKMLVFIRNASEYLTNKN